MTILECNLCSYIYDEAQESKEFESLSSDWVCPICGSPKSSFSITKLSKKSSGASPELKKESFATYECGLCSYVYDEAKENLKWEKLSFNWTCPVWDA